MPDGVWLQPGIAYIAIDQFNAAGGLNSAFEPGDVMEDEIDFAQFGRNAVQATIIPMTTAMRATPEKLMKRPISPGRRNFSPRKRQAATAVRTGTTLTTKLAAPAVTRRITSRSAELRNRTVVERMSPVVTALGYEERWTGHDWGAWSDMFVGALRTAMDA